LGDDAKLNRTAFKDIAREALLQLKEAGADKKKIAVFEERFEHLAGPEHNVQDEDKIRKLQRQAGSDRVVLALSGERVGGARHTRHDPNIPPPGPAKTAGRSSRPTSSDAADTGHDLAA
jgi:hypothetical protein